MTKFFKNGSLKGKGQVAIEYALAMVVLAAVASWIFIFYLGISEKTFYGVGIDSSKRLSTMGLEQTVALPFP